MQVANYSMPEKELKKENLKSSLFFFKLVLGSYKQAGLGRRRQGGGAIIYPHFFSPPAIQISCKLTVPVIGVLEAPICCKGQLSNDPCTCMQEGNSLYMGIARLYN